MQNIKNGKSVLKVYFLLYVNILIINKKNPSIPILGFGFL